MDLSAIIVTVVLTVLFFGTFLWLSIQSRRKQVSQASSKQTARKIEEVSG
jgi:preprotein translocase subunit SecG